MVFEVRRAKRGLAQCAAHERDIRQELLLRLLLLLLFGWWRPHRQSRGRPLQGHGLQGRRRARVGVRVNDVGRLRGAR